ncbi:histidine phosphatase family protein [Ideonella sp.]|uniref:histidine phosphatase family protein n=1 Tax=Ideonella sp. TaxID=1929293 RepID=UPI0035AF495B
MSVSDRGPCLAWRHPRPDGAAGRCVGAGTDLPVDPRRAKRLAHRIRRTARHAGLPRVVATSPLHRCADVGRWLRRWGWRHVVDAGLREVDFGRWDGQRWDTVGQPAVDAWCADFAHHAPGGGESLQALLHRVRAWHPPPGCRVLVTHGGWLLARHWLDTHGAGELPTAATWPAAPPYGACVALAEPVGAAPG